MGCGQYHQPPGGRHRDRYLYAVSTVDDPKFVKFGIAVNPKKRFYGIQSSCPLELSLDATIPHYLGLESQVHADLKLFGIRGEWYIGCDEIYRAVEIMKGGDARLFGDYINTLSYLTPDEISISIN